MNKYQQIKEYVDEHFKYYAFYPYDIVLNMDTENEEDARLQFQNGNYQYYDISDFTEGHELIGVTEEVCDS